MGLIHFPAFAGTVGSQIGFSLLRPAFFLIGKLLILGPGFVHISGFIATYAWVLLLVVLLRSALRALRNADDDGAK
jgi:hypothetical protein